MAQPDRRSLKRRALLKAAAGAAAAGLAGCGRGPVDSGSGGGDSITFWDMVWGTGADYTTAAGELAGQYEPAEGALPVTYQSIPWANWYQTFTSAVASNTGPAISTGAAFQPFFFLEQGAVAPADDVIERLGQDGKGDFLPGLLESMQTDQGYAGVPWSLDLRVLWYRKSLLEQAGVDPPADWDGYLAAGEALRKIDKIGFGLAASSTTTDAQHSVFAFMINNGGGLFTEDGEPDCVNERNLETCEFFAELVAKKIIDPAAANYSADNLDSDWHSGKIAMGLGQTGHDLNFDEADREDVMLASPIKGPHGDTGTIYYINALMLYSNTPSLDAGNAFAAWYLSRTAQLWDAGVMIDLPVTRSVADSDAVAKSPKLTKAIEEWQPIGKTLAAQSPHPFGALNAVDGGQPAARFVQQLVQGEQRPKPMLEELQRGLEELVK